MKFVISWEPRAGGSALDNEASSFRFLELRRNWGGPAAESTMHQQVLRIDGNGGFAIVESDAGTLCRTLMKFSPHFEYHVYPVVDSDEGLQYADEAEAFHKSIK